MKEINIQALIAALIAAKNKGAETVVLSGDATLHTKGDNTVIITTLPQH